MNKQMSLSAFTDELAQVRTKKKEFLEQINRIIPWGEWITLIQPSYYKGERGNKPYDLEVMLRIYMLQNLYDLSDEGTVAEAIDSRAFSDFCRVDSSNQVPNGDTLGRFRNLLIQNDLQEKLFMQGAEKREDAIVRNNKGKKIRYQINRRPSQIKKLSRSGQYKTKKREHKKSSVRAKVKHVFGVVMGFLKSKKIRYRTAPT